MKCKNCGEKVANKEKFCPKCGEEITYKNQDNKKFLNKKSKAVIAVICSLVLIISGTVGGLYFFRNHTDNLTDSDSNYISFSEGFTDVLVTDEKSALEAIASVANVIGIENVDDELKISSINTVDSDTYYRFQQYYNNIPVYGNSIVISTDNESNATALTSNFVPITEDISLEPVVTQNQVDVAVKKYLKYDDIEIEKIGDENLVIYNTDDKYVLAYELSVNGMESVIVDADTSKVVNYKALFNDIAAEVVAENDNNINAIGWKNDDGSYHLYNDEYKISVFDVNNITTYKENGSLYHIDFKEYQKGFLFKKNIDTLYSKDNIFEKSAVQALNEIIKISDFYKNLGDSGFDRFHVAINDSYDDGNNARGLGGNDDIKWGLILLGKNFDFAEKDVIAHEYAHAIAGKILNWSGADNTETAALNEAYSDIFGSLYENRTNPDWKMIHLSQMIRDITDPHNTDSYANMSDIKKSDNYNQYTLSTIISHSAYLMWNGIDGNEQGRIDANTLAKIWYRSLFLLQSDATFSQCRNAVELSARSLWKSGNLTEKQYDTVIQAFNKVGIDRVSNYANKTLKNDFNMLVLNSEGKERVSAEIKIYPSTTSSNVFFANKNKIVFEGTFNSTSPEEGIHINLKDGRYLVEISDTATKKFAEPIGMIIEVDGNSKVATDNLTVYTDFKEINTVIINKEQQNLIADENDFKELALLLENVDFCGYPFEYSASDSDAYKTVLSELLGPYTSVPLYEYIYGKDIVYVDATNGCFKDSPKAEQDPLNKYGNNYRYGKVSADEIDWIIKNIFNVSPDRLNATIMNDENCVVYYFENHYYFSCGDGGDVGVHSVIKDKQVNENNVYTIEYDLISNGDNSTCEGTYEIVCELKYIDGNRQWSFISIADKSRNGNSQSNTTNNQTEDKKGSFAGNQTAEQLRISIIGSWGALGSFVPEYNFIDSTNCSGDMPWKSSGTYQISNNKTLTINWTGDGPEDIKTEIYFWSSETWDEFHSHYENKGKKFWYMTDDGVLKINGKEKYREGVDNYTYNTDGELLASITGTWISENGFNEYRINSDGTWVESTVIVSAGKLIKRTTLDNGKVEIVDDTTAKLWQEVEHLNQIPGASELIYDSKNDKISVGNKNNCFSRAKYK